MRRCRGSPEWLRNPRRTARSPSSRLMVKRPALPDASRTVSGRSRIQRSEAMPWINLTLRRGALPKPIQHAVMAKLTEVLMWWEKVPNTPTARKVMKGWVYEVAEDADYNG